MGLYGSYTVAEDVNSVVESITKQDVLKVFVLWNCLLYRKRERLAGLNFCSFEEYHERFHEYL